MDRDVSHGAGVDDGTTRAEAPGGLTRPVGVLIDWDNTLVSSWAAILDALNAALAVIDRAAMVRRQVRALLRDPDSGDPGIAFGTRWDEAKGAFIAAMAKAQAGAEHLFQARAHFGAVRRAGVPVCVITGRQSQAVSG